MLLSKIVRTVRKSVILGVILTVALLYCFVSIAKQLHSSKSSDENEDLTIHRQRQPFQWQSSSDDQNITELRPLTCRNSAQGKRLITDDRGYICQRQDILSSGCCDLDLTATKRYSCETCKDNHCCSIYEHCISCCLNPEKKPLLQTVIGKATGNFNLLFGSVKDHFELCLVKCRTSSQSVQHENSYRDARHKYCFGEQPPSIPASH